TAVVALRLQLELPVKVLRQILDEESAHGFRPKNALFYSYCCKTLPLCYLFPKFPECAGEDGEGRGPVLLEAGLIAVDEAVARPVSSLLRSVASAHHCLSRAIDGR